MPSFQPPEFEVDIRLTLNDQPYKAKAKICMCPFCRNIEAEKKNCGLCEGQGIIIKLRKMPPIFNPVVIKGGKE